MIKLKHALVAFGQALVPNRWAGLAIIFGAMTVLGFAPFELSPFALAGLTGLFWLWLAKSNSLADGARYGLWFGIGQFGVGVSWLFSSIYFYSEAGLLAAIILVALFVLLLSSFVALAGLVIRKLASHNWPGAALLWLMPAVWVLVEWLRTHTFGGLPFLLMGTSHLDTWLDGYAPVFGVYGVSFAVAMTAGLLVWMLQYRQVLPAALVMVFLWPLGGSLQKVAWVNPVDDPVSVALIQGNISQDIKWQTSEFANMMRLYTRLTREHLDAQIVVWPETAIPGYYDQAAAGLLRHFVGDAQLQSRDIVVGAITRPDPSANQYFNSMINLRQPDQIYHKRKLVLFGEYYPMSGVIESVADYLNLPFSQFSAGPARQPLMELAGHSVGVSICFEMMFGALIARDVPQARFLITASNDAWFSHTLEPAQLRQEAQMRARELGREIARVTNTGYTVIIGVDGQVKQQIPAYEVGVLRGHIQPYEGQTPFSRWTHWPVLIWSWILLMIAVYLKRNNFSEIVQGWLR
ncbi:apolipoprotein N-acyltransferase [Thiomicrospira sp. ALE5]|uniref:apolipoprotein N-acyltransferase n=1 Tax=Thiomicrospira sp. ALE5 TaxID=748650 RepID=UPI0008E023C4|nr:apolipoprotein N-acyltransferase [Thiomicrospira sp. ALE5]SFR53797.1 apolipoprotein N-acyltransferase [Thiomicrospira sp. ALE5]